MSRADLAVSPDAAWAAVDLPVPTGPWPDLLYWAVGIAVLAPSTHNTQPWLFRLRPGSVELFADRTRALAVADPEHRELVMSCGAALCTLRLALAYAGQATRIAPLPDPKDPDLLARVSLLDVPLQPGAEVHDLFQAVGRRHTNRGPFTGPVRPPTRRHLVTAAAEEGARLVFLDDTACSAVAELVALADRQQMADHAFRRELAHWLHGNNSRRLDGMRGENLGLGRAPAPVQPLLIRTFDPGSGRAAHDRQLAIDSPALALLTTTEDGTADHLVAGQALQHVLLRAAVDGVWASFLNQPIETAELRERLATVCGVAGQRPQALLRLGYGSPGPHTPRRPVGRVLLGTPG